MNMGPVGRAEFLKSGGVVGWNVSFWQCDPVSLYSLKESASSHHSIYAFNIDTQVPNKTVNSATVD